MRRGSRMPLFALGLLGLALAMPLQAQEEESPHGLKPRFDFYIGGFWPTTSTTLRLDANDGSAGTEIDLEDDLGVSDREVTPTAGFRWRIAGGHGIQVGYFDLDREGSTTLEAEIKIGDEVYQFNESVESGMGTSVLYVDYAYDFFHDRPRSSLGIAAGLHVTSVDFFIRSRDQDKETSADTTAPLPVIGLFGSKAFGKRWVFMGLGQIFALKFDDYEGRLVNLWTEFQFNAFRHVGFGFGYSFFGVDLDATKDDFTGSLRWDYGGPMLTLRFYF